MCKIERSWTISGVFKAKAEKVVTSSKRFSQERRWRQEKRKMCLKQNLEAAKLCRVERQMTEEGIIFSIYSCLHLLFLHVLSFSFCIRLDDVFRYEEKLFKLSWSFQSSICHKVVIFSGITDYFVLKKMKFVLVHFHPASRTIWIDWYSKSNVNFWFDKIKYFPNRILLHK